MTLDPNKVAERLGADHIGQVPDTGGGAFGMAHLAEVMKQRLDVRGGRRRGSAIGWVLSGKVPMSTATEKLLVALAEKLSTPQQRISPMELAALLLEESVRRLANEQTP
ncbi:MAG: hypothetical protein HYR84_01895 [Planctomycetes bacterium]|nr:hypothetical protein [Planctomycetota bacterium]